MSTPVIAFFNNNSGIGKTSLVYHLAWMYSNSGLRVVAADLDPQANLTSALLDDDRLIELWPDGNHKHTVYGYTKSIQHRGEDIADPHLEIIENYSFAGPIALLVGDLLLASFELAQEAHKPMFQLKPADGAMGSHMQAVQGAFLDFRLLAQKIAERTQVRLVQ